MLFRAAVDNIPPSKPTNFSAKINQLFPNLINFEWDNQKNVDPDLAGGRAANRDGREIPQSPVAAHLNANRVFQDIGERLHLFHLGGDFDHRGKRRKVRQSDHAGAGDLDRFDICGHRLEVAAVPRGLLSAQQRGEGQQKDRGCKETSHGQPDVPRDSPGRKKRE